MEIVDLNLSVGHLAIPEIPSLEDFLKDTEFGSKIISIEPQREKNTESLKMFTEVDEVLVELEIDFYAKIKDPTLKGYSPLSCYAISISAEANNVVARKLGKLFPECVTFNPTGNYEKKGRTRFEERKAVVYQNGQFFDRYKAIRKKLDVTSELPDKIINSGLFFKTIKEKMSQDLKDDFNPDTFYFRLFNQVEGVYDGVEVELSLVYFSAPALGNSIRGVYLASKDKALCHCEGQNTDHARSFSGHFFSPDLVLYGGSVLKTENLGTLTWSTHLEHSTTIGLAGDEIPWKNVDEAIKSSENMNGEQTRKLTKLAYDLSNSTLS
jgi:hypothetical protein